MAKKTSRKPPPTRAALRMDPDADWGKVPNKASDGQELCDQILAELTAADLKTWQVARDYFTKTESIVKDMKAKFDDGMRPSDKQLAALKGWLEGVRKWTKKKESDDDEREEDDESDEAPETGSAGHEVEWPED